MSKWPNRKPTEPPGEVVPLGPHVGFIEDLETNIGLIRHGVCHRHLRFEHFLVGGDHADRRRAGLHRGARPPGPAGAGMPPSAPVKAAVYNRYLDAG